MAHYGLWIGGSAPSQPTHETVHGHPHTCMRLPVPIAPHFYVRVPTKVVSDDAFGGKRWDWMSVGIEPGCPIPQVINRATTPHKPIYDTQEDLDNVPYWGFALPFISPTCNVSYLLPHVMAHKIVVVLGSQSRH